MAGMTLPELTDDERQALAIVTDFLREAYPEGEYLPSRAMHNARALLLRLAAYYPPLAVVRRDRVMSEAEADEVQRLRDELRLILHDAENAEEPEVLLDIAGRARRALGE